MASRKWPSGSSDDRPLCSRTRPDAYQALWTARDVDAMAVKNLRGMVCLEVQKSYDYNLYALHMRGLFHSLSCCTREVDTALAFTRRTFILQVLDNKYAGHAFVTI
jgi:hypothetical protein